MAWDRLSVMASGGATCSRRALLLAGAGVAVGAGCVRQQPIIENIALEDDGGPNAVALQKLLDKRAKALRGGDERGFLADLDQSNAKLIQQQKMLFRNLTQFTFKKFGYMTSQVYSPNQVDGLYQFQPVLQVMQLDTDAAPGGVVPAEAYHYSVAVNGDSLVVANIVGAAFASGEFQLPTPALLADGPWNFAPLEVTRVGKVWLAADDSVPDLDKYASAVASQLAAVEDMWGDRAKFPGHTLFFTRNAAHFKTWFSHGAAPNFDPGIEGISVPKEGVRTNGDVYSGQYAGNRIVVNLANIERFDDNPEAVVRHELVHAVTARAGMVSAGSFSAARWALEGFARWFDSAEDEDRKAGVLFDVAQGVSAGKFEGTAPGSEEFYGEDIGFNYNLSASVFFFVEEIKGREAAVELYEHLIDVLDVVLTADPGVFANMCPAVLGMQAADFLQQWTSYVRGL